MAKTNLLVGQKTKLKKHLHEKKNVLNTFEHGTFDPLGHATKVGPFSSYEYCVKDNSLKKY